MSELIPADMYWLASILYIINNQKMSHWAYFFQELKQTKFKKVR